MMTSENKIQKVLNEGISYFGKDEVIYVYECKKVSQTESYTKFCY